MKITIDIAKLTGIQLSIIRALQVKKKRGWDKIYFAIDLHDTITWSSYTKDEAPKKEFFPFAIDALQALSKRRDVVLILYTSSYSEYLKDYLDTFIQNSIYFKYHNENPECPSTDIGDFSKKFYFNVLLDDKAGFDPVIDWKRIHNLITILSDSNEIKYVYSGVAVSDIQTYLRIK
jgi:hypothetical protein